MALTALVLFNILATIIDLLLLKVFYRERNIILTVPVFEILATIIYLLHLKKCSFYRGINMALTALVFNILPTIFEVTLVSSILVSFHILILL